MVQTMAQDQQDAMMNVISSIESEVDAIQDHFPGAIQDQHEKMTKMIQSIESKVDALVPVITSQCTQQNNLEAKVQLQLEITKVMEQINSIDAVMNDLVPRGTIRRTPTLSQSTGRLPLAKPAGSP